MRGELIKTLTTRTLLGYAAIGVLLAAGTALIVLLSGDATGVQDKKEAIAGAPFVFMLLGVVGAAGEYRHRTAAPAVLVSGRGSGPVLIARMGAYALAGVAIASVMAAVSLAVGLPLLGNEPGRALGAGQVFGVVSGSLLAAALSAIIGVAIGALIRNQVAAVVGVLIFTFVVSPLIVTLSETVAHYTPLAAALLAANDGAMSWGGAALVVGAWTVVLLVAALLAERRRDMA
jgi:hypothetical protein